MHQAAALILKDKQVLLVTTNGERYKTPSGPKDEGVSYAQAIRTIVREQLGVSVVSMRKFHTVRTTETANGQFAIITYFLVTIDGEPQPNGRVRALTWYGDGSRERTELVEQPMLEKLLLEKLI